MTTTASPRPGPRPWLAALLSLLVPGLGQLYAWRVPAALLCWLASLVAGAAGLVVLSRAAGPLSLVVPIVLGVAVRVAIAAHAWRIARLAGAAGAAGAPRPRGIALAAVLGAAVVVAVLAGAVERGAFERSLARAFRVPSGSMSPAILSGDLLIVRARLPHSTPRHEEIVAYRWEGNSMIKRVAGVAGDTLAMRGGRLVRNGVPVAEPYAHGGRDMPGDETFGWQRKHLVGDSSSYHATANDWGPLVVPPGQIFLLGDNRGNSLDSRYVGFIAADSAFGVPAFVYFSRDPMTGAVRWNRIGHVVR